mmetsp:Transcript_20953/g.49541  ORF Transcript_20953/g.49541 Transcript_20953/m.49541 type:complete len:432 (+) Transcript_20953:384-1679(+)
MTLTTGRDDTSSTMATKFAWFVLALAASPLGRFNAVQGFGTVTHKGAKTPAVNHATQLAVSTSSEQPGLKTRKVASSFINEIKKRLNWRNTNAAFSNDLYMSEATQKIANIQISWEPEMAQRILDLQQERLEAGVAEDAGPLMVGVVGIPGSGKSTSCEIMQKLLGDQAIVMPMDGYHYSLKQLETFPNPVDAIYRRGAPDTFNPAALHTDLTRIVHNPHNEAHVSIPGFDHAKGDPTPEQHTFDRQKHKIVICEGIYLMHDSDGWEEIKDLMDHSIYIVADIDQCISRLKERNKCIPGYTPEEIDIRCDAVDRVNAQMAEMSRRYAVDEVYSAASTSVSESTLECDIDVDEMVSALDEEDLPTIDMDLSDPSLLMVEEGMDEEELDEPEMAHTSDKTEDEPTEGVANGDATAHATAPEEIEEEAKVSYYF